jgi:hypothetical protein
MISWRFVQFEAEKAPHAQRIGRVQTFEVAEQQHAEISAGRQTRTA